MKIMIVLSLLCAGLLLAASAHAFAIYNHVDYEVCVSDTNPFHSCKFKVKAHSTFNGEHGAGFKHAGVSWFNNDKTKSYSVIHHFDIPDGGYARIYKHEVKVYKHSGKHVKTIGVESFKVNPNN